MNTTPLWAAAALAVAGLSCAHAALINVNYTGTTVTPPESTLSGPGGGLATEWNSLTDTGPSGPLVDSTGATTTVSITTSGYDATPTEHLNTSGLLPVFLNSTNTFPRPNSATVTLSGLEDGGFYDIWIMSYRDFDLPGFDTERSVGTWATTNTTTSASSQLVDSQILGTDGFSFVEGYNYVLFENVVATGGVISFTGQGAGSLTPTDTARRLHLNGLQINQVPEPSAALLGGLGLLALLRRRR